MQITSKKNLYRKQKKKKNIKQGDKEISEQKEPLNKTRSLRLRETEGHHRHSGDWRWLIHTSIIKAITVNVKQDYQ